MSIHIHIHQCGPDLPGQLDRLETTMATAAEQLAQLDGRFDDFAADVRAKLDVLAAERENFSPEGQAAFDALADKLSALDTEVGDADGSDVPPVEEPGTPAEPDQPVV